MKHWSRPTNPRALWLTLFVVVNIICGVIIYCGGHLLGETQNLRLDDPYVAYPATVIVVLTYVVLLALVFPALARVKIAPRVHTRPDGRQSKAVGILLFLLQVGFIAFFEATGTFVAGSTERSDSALSVVWVVVSVDTLFFVYYGFYRESRLFWPNLAISVVSNVLRGWTGIFILIAFMESARAMRRGQFSLKLLAPLALVFVLAFPALNLLKLQIRFMSSGAAQDVSFVSLASGVIEDLRPSDYADIVQSSGEGLLARMSLVSNTIAVEQFRGVLAGAVRDGEIEPYWKEGIYGLAYDRLAGNVAHFNIGVGLAYAIDPDQEEGSWNSNPGYASWLILDPLAAPIYLAYTLGLLFLCVAAIKRMGGDAQAYDMLWWACLGYLVPGWTASFVLFANSLLAFYAYHALTARFAARSAAPGPASFADRRMAS